MGFGALHITQNEKKNKYIMINRIITGLVLTNLSIIILLHATTLYQLIALIIACCLFYYFTAHKLIIVPSLIKTLLFSIILQMIILSITLI